MKIFFYSLILGTLLFPSRAKSSDHRSDLEKAQERLIKTRRIVEQIIEIPESLREKNAAVISAARQWRLNSTTYPNYISVTMNYEEALDEFTNQCLRVGSDLRTQYLRNYRTYVYHYLKSGRKGPIHDLTADILGNLEEEY